MADQNTPNQPDITGLDQERLLALLSYLTVLVVIPLLIGRDQPFVRFHAKQGLLLLVGIIISLIIASWIPVLGNVLFLLLMLIDIVALVQTILGRTWKIPVIGDLAQKISI